MVLESRTVMKATKQTLLVVVVCTLSIHSARGDGRNPDAAPDNSHPGECVVPQKVTTQQNDVLSLGFLPLAPTMLWDGRSSAEGSPTVGHFGVLALGLMAHWEPYQGNRAVIGLSGSVVAVGGPFDRIWTDDLADGPPAAYLRLGATLRWLYGLVDGQWNFTVGMGAGLMGFVVPRDAGGQDESSRSTFGGLGIYLVPCTLGFEWLIPDSTAGIGIQMDVMELGVVFSLNGTATRSVAQQYLARISHEGLQRDRRNAGEFWARGPPARGGGPPARRARRREHDQKAPADRRSQPKTREKCGLTVGFGQTTLYATIRM